MQAGPVQLLSHQSFSEFSALSLSCLAGALAAHLSSTVSPRRYIELRRHAVAFSQFQLRSQAAPNAVGSPKFGSTGEASMAFRYRLCALLALSCFVVPSLVAQETLAAQYRSRHVFVVMEENRSLSIASEYMPYLKSLAAQYGQGMQVYSDSHGSWLADGGITVRLKSLKWG